MLSPVDIQNKQFKKNKIGGYNIDEVDEFLEQILKSFQELINENYSLKDKMNTLNESVQYYRTMESTIQNVLVLADKTAQDTKSAAYEKADEIKKEAEERADQMISTAEQKAGAMVEQAKQEVFELSKKAEDIKRQYGSYKTQFKQFLQSQMELLDQGDRSMAQYDEENKETAIDEAVTCEAEVAAVEDIDESALSLEEPSKAVTDVCKEEQDEVRGESILVDNQKLVTVKTASNDAEEDNAFFTKEYVPISKSETDN